MSLLPAPCISLVHDPLVFPLDIIAAKQKEIPQGNLITHNSSICTSITDKCRPHKHTHTHIYTHCTCTSSKMTIGELDSFFLQRLGLHLSYMYTVLHNLYPVGGTIKRSSSFLSSTNEFIITFQLCLSCSIYWQLLPTSEQDWPLFKASIHKCTDPNKGQ